jgi:hypothetical protein
MAALRTAISDFDFLEVDELDCKPRVSGEMYPAIYRQSSKIGLAHIDSFLDPAAVAKLFNVVRQAFEDLALCGTGGRAVDVENWVKFAVKWIKKETLS